jgi:hypothetical protein
MDLCQWGVQVLCTPALVKHGDIVYLWWFAAEFGMCNVLLNAVVSLEFCNAQKTYILNPNQNSLLNSYLYCFFLTPGLYLKPLLHCVSYMIQYTHFHIVLKRMVLPVYCWGVTDMIYSSGCHWEVVNKHVSYVIHIHIM